jgi:hypothetical protein
MPCRAVPCMHARRPTLLPEQTQARAGGIPQHSSARGWHPSVDVESSRKQVGIAGQDRASFVLDRAVVAVVVGWIVACQEMQAWRQSNVSEQLSSLGSIASPVFSLAAFPGCWSYLSSHSPSQLACRVGLSPTNSRQSACRPRPAYCIGFLPTTSRPGLLALWQSACHQSSQAGVLRISWMHATAN